MRNLLVIVSLLATFAVHGQSLNDIHRLLLGKWVSVTDTTTILTIDKDSVYERYYDQVETRGVFRQRIIYRGKTYSYFNSHYILKPDTSFLNKSKCSFRTVYKDKFGHIDTINGYIFHIDDHVLKMDPFSDILTYKRVP